MSVPAVFTLSELTNPVHEYVSGGISAPNDLALLSAVHVTGTCVIERVPGATVKM